MHFVPWALRERRLRRMFRLIHLLPPKRLYDRLGPLCTVFINALQSLLNEITI